VSSDKRRDFASFAPPSQLSGLTPSVLWHPANRFEKQTRATTSCFGRVWFNLLCEALQGEPIMQCQHHRLRDTLWRFGRTDWDVV
jgi:hypothetical protein